MAAPSRPKRKPGRPPVRRIGAKPKPAARKRNAKPFGGFTISFAGRRDTLESVFGKRPIPPSELNKKIWAFIKANGLTSKD